MARVFEVRDEVWEAVEPLLPVVPPAATGRPRVPDRVAFNAIVFVLVTGIAWRFVPQELGCSGVTAWRRLRDWRQAGVCGLTNDRLYRRAWSVRSAISWMTRERGKHFDPDVVDALTSSIAEISNTGSPARLVRA